MPVVLGARKQRLSKSSAPGPENQATPMAALPDPVKNEYRFSEAGLVTTRFRSQEITGTLKSISRDLTAQPQLALLAARDPERALAAGHTS